LDRADCVAELFLVDPARWGLRNEKDEKRLRLSFSAVRVLTIVEEEDARKVFASVLVVLFLESRAEIGIFRVLNLVPGKIGASKEVAPLLYSLFDGDNLPIKE
jgi:hypothetical protein